MTISNTYEADVLDTLVGNTPTNAAAGAARYLALFTADPTDAGTQTSEISGGSYARVDTASSWAAASSGSVATNAAITFPTATADWADGSPNQVAYWALCDAASAGNIVWSGAFTTARTVLSGDTFSIASGSLTLSLD